MLSEVSKQEKKESSKLDEENVHSKVAVIKIERNSRRGFVSFFIVFDDFYDEKKKRRDKDYRFRTREKRFLGGEGRGGSSREKVGSRTSSAVVVKMKPKKTKKEKRRRERRKRRHRHQRKKAPMIQSFRRRTVKKKKKK